MSSTPLLQRDHPATPSVPILARSESSLPILANSSSSMPPEYLQSPGTPRICRALPDTRSDKRRSSDSDVQISTGDIIGPRNYSISPSSGEPLHPSSPADRVLRVRERLASRRAEWAMEATHRPSRHIYDPTPTNEIPRQVFHSLHASAFSLSPPPQQQRSSPSIPRHAPEHVRTPTIHSEPNPIGFTPAPSAISPTPERTLLMTQSMWEVPATFTSIAAPLVLSGRSDTESRDISYLQPQYPQQARRDTTIHPPLIYPHTSGDTSYDSLDHMAPLPQNENNLINLWNRSIQQTVDRRLPVEVQREARMLPYLGEGFTPARIATLHDGVYAGSRDDDSVTARAYAVAGPGGGRGRWGEIEQADELSRSSMTHPYLRNRSQAFERNESPTRHDTLPHQSDQLGVAQGDPSRGIAFRDGQTHDERRDIVRILTTTVKRLPSDLRRTLAASTLRKISWEFQDNAEVEAFCSVCHDEYKGNSDVSVTPCNHAYHRNCIKTWLDQQGVASCPMCRRDLVSLVYVERFMSGIGSKQEALALWLSI